MLRALDVTSLVTALALSSSLAAQPLMVAHVNDPLSHGTLGDNLLSLDEAIRAMNATLPLTSLSTAERARVTGTGAAIDTVEIDFAVTPTITMERQLTNIFGDPVVHADVWFFSLNGNVVIQADDSIQEVWPIRTNHGQLNDFIVRGGQTGVTMDSSLHYHPGRRFLLNRCVFEDQKQRCVEYRIPQFPPGEIEPGDFQDTVFRNSPIGINVVDRGIAGDLELFCRDLTIDNCATGIKIDVLGSSSTLDVRFSRTEITGATDGVVVRRNSFVDSSLQLSFDLGEIHASRHGFDIQTENIGFGPNVISVHHTIVRAGGGAADYAFRTTPATGWFDIAMGENDFDGNVEIHSGSFSGQQRIHNSLFTNGSFTLGNRMPATPSDLQWNAHESSPITIDAGTTGAVQLNACELFSSPADNPSAAAVTLTNCFRSSSALSGSIANTAPTPAPWLGHATVSPRRPALGSQLMLGVDLQPNTAVAWMLGAPLATPLTAITPWRFYMDFALSIPLPGFVVTGQQTLPLSIPTNPIWVGAELYCQPVLFPTAGQPYVPVFSLPAGGLFEIVP